MKLATSCSILFITMLVMAAASPDPRGAETGTWCPGPYLMLDKTLVTSRNRVRREINHPSRLPDPIVTAYEDKCYQPWVTVLRDSKTGLFRLWYNIPAKPESGTYTHLAYLESEDGIHWRRPARVLDTPPIQFGASVLDEGPDYADPAKRFKFAWWKDGGLQIAVSPDGLAWKHLVPGVVLPTKHDVTRLAWDPLRKRYMALVSHYFTEGEYKYLRIPHQSVSEDLIHWREPWMIIKPDPKAAIEKGETQFYGIAGVICRGNLLVGMIKVLRDDLNCEPGKTAGELQDYVPERKYAGLGYTVLGWSHDGEQWQRDTEPFLDRNTQPGTWDRAMTWVDSQLIVGDYVYLYYGGYRWGHKAGMYTDRHIGFAHMPRDRYVAWSAGYEEGGVRTKVSPLKAARLTVNAQVDIHSGELRVRVLDEQGRPYPGFDGNDCPPLKGDRVDHAVQWKADIAQLKGRPVQFEFVLKQAKLYSFDLHD